MVGKETLPLHSKDVLISISIVVLSLLLSYLFTVPNVCGVFHDDAIYVSTAKALAEGDGYRLINLPDSPDQTKYPILYPFLLSLVWRVFPQFPQNLLLMQLLTSLIGAIAVGLCYLYLVSSLKISRLLSFVSCTVCITTPEFLYFATQTLSEMLFMFLLVIALWVFDRSRDNFPGTRMHQFAIGIILALPYLCRSIGVAVVISVLICWYLGRRPMRWTILGMASAIVPWLLWVYGSVGSFSRNQVEGYYTDYIGWWIDSGIFAIGRVFISNFFYLLVGIARLVADGVFELANPMSGTGFQISMLLLGSITLISILFTKSESELLNWFLISYLLIICVWPWPPYRFLIPILPFITANLFNGINLSVRRFLPGRRMRLLNIGIFLLLLSTNLVLSHKTVNIQNSTGYPQRDSSDPVHWTSYEEVFNWLKRNSLPEDIVASGLDSMVYLYTDLRAIRPFTSRPASLFYGHEYPSTGTVQDLLVVLRSYRPRYLAQLAMPRFSEEKPFGELVEEFTCQYPDLLVPVYTGRDPRFRVFEINIDQLSSIEK